jgi:hypothetical protein
MLIFLYTAIIVSMNKLRILSIYHTYAVIFSVIYVLHNGQFLIAPLTAQFSHRQR